MSEGGRERPLVVAILVLPTALALALTWAIYSHFRIRVPPRLSGDARAAAMASLRAAVDGGTVVRPSSEELDRPLSHRGPVVVTVFARGKEVARVVAHGDSAASAIENAARRLSELPELSRQGPQVRAAMFIRVDLSVARGPLATKPALLRSLSLHPGLEGLGVTIDGEQEVVLTPDELADKRLLTAGRPVDFIPDLRLGLDFERADMLLAAAADLPPGGYGQAQRRYWRFRTDSFVEAPPDARGTTAPLALTRGRPPAPAVNASSLRDAALAGGRYLVAHLAPTGRYVYEVDLASGRATDPRFPHPYSLPRHAGTTYFLAELYRHTKEPWLREPIERAFRHLRELVDAGDCSGVLESGRAFACVVDKGQRVAGLGSSALTVVALAEYKRATGSDTYDDLARALTEWILFMQRDDGSFAHLYDLRSGKRDEKTQLLYFSGEAALALARMHDVHGDERYREATERALDDLMAFYDFFAGGFFYGEDHWTCIAAEAAWPALKHARYREFCAGYGEFLRRQQPGPGDFPDQLDVAGAYTFTPFVMPANTPAGSRTEAMISAYLLGSHHGEASPAIREQILAAMGYALGQQVRAESAWAFPVGLAPEGAIPGSPIDRNVRIDYVQHVCSAFIRAAEILD